MKNLNSGLARFVALRCTATWEEAAAAVHPGEKGALRLRMGSDLAFAVVLCFVDKFGVTPSIRSGLCKQRETRSNAVASTIFFSTLAGSCGQLEDFKENRQTQPVFIRMEREHSLLPRSLGTREVRDYVGAKESVRSKPTQMGPWKQVGAGSRKQQ